MDSGEQWITIAAVLLGSLMTHITNYTLERAKHRHEFETRWDGRKLDAYAGYVDRVRASIYLAVQLYEHREGIRESEKPERELLSDIGEAGRQRGRAFERVMLLGGDPVVEAAHRLNASVAEIDWQATGKTLGTLDEWRARNRKAFAAINAFHDEARDDLGVSGSVTGESHPERDLLLPPARKSGDASES